MKSISLFTGAGGLDIGLERAGFKVLSAVDIDPVFCQTLTENKRIKHPIATNPQCFHFEDTDIVCSDISKIPANILAKGEADIDCVFGGPPCQPFSSAGKMGSTKDPRGMLYEQFINVVDEIRPKTFLFENVRGLITARCGDGQIGGVIQNIINAFENIGYSCRAALLNAADFGWYQRRVRCFILGSNCGDAPDFPLPTHSRHPFDAAQQQDQKKPWRTLREFLDEHADENIANWVRPTADLKKSLDLLPDGSGLKSAGIIESTRPNGHWGYRQGAFIADVSLPARTVTGSTSQDFIRLPDNSLRRLTFEEIKALQGFPADWRFAGNKTQRFKQVGNAVPTIFSETIGYALRNYLSHEYNPKHPARKIPMPSDILKHIEYTKKEERRNGASRMRLLPG